MISRAEALNRQRLARGMADVIAETAAIRQRDPVVFARSLNDEQWHLVGLIAGARDPKYVPGASTRELVIDELESRASRAA